MAHASQGQQPRRFIRAQSRLILTKNCMEHYHFRVFTLPSPTTTPVESTTKIHQFLGLQPKPSFTCMGHSYVCKTGDPLVLDVSSFLPASFMQHRHGASKAKCLPTYLGVVVARLGNLEVRVAVVIGVAVGVVADYKNQAASHRNIKSTRDQGDQHEIDQSTSIISIILKEFIPRLKITLNIRPTNFILDF